MAHLINELKVEHTSLIDSFNGIKSIDITSEESSKQLQSIKSDLLEHLRKENEMLYIKMREVAFNNLQLQHTLDLFSRDIARLSTVIIQFLDKYSGGGSSLAFRRDFNRLSVILEAYVRREEEIIFNEFLNSPLGKVA